MGWLARPRIVVSRCLGFDSCRWNGAMIPDDFVEALKPFVEYHTLCPESDIGLGVPRNPVRIVSSSGSLRLVQQGTNRDVTEDLLAFADRSLTALGEVDGFILKSRSPSCGIKDSRVYPGMEKAAALRSSAGIFGGEVLRRFPNLAIEDEGRLNNDRIWDHFLKRVFTFAKFRELKKTAQMRDLVQFQAENKLMLMSYGQVELRNLGRIVANRKGYPLDVTKGEYEKHLQIAMTKIPRDTANINVLMHAMGFFSERISREEKEFFLDVLDKYRLERIPLSVPVSLVKSWTIRFDQEYLKPQTFLNPYPDELSGILGKGVARDLRR